MKIAPKLTDREQLAQWRTEIAEAVKANAFVCADDPDWGAINNLEDIAEVACDMIERLLQEKHQHP